MTKDKDAAYDIVHEDKVIQTLYSKDKVWDFYFALYHGLKGADGTWTLKGIGVSGLYLQNCEKTKTWTTKIRRRRKNEPPVEPPEPEVKT